MQKKHTVIHQKWEANRDKEEKDYGYKQVIVYF